MFVPKIYKQKIFIISDMARNDFTKLILVILVVVSYFILSLIAYWKLNEVSPFSKEFNFGITFVIVLGFYVGAGFTFKKLKLF